MNPTVGRKKMPLLAGAYMSLEKLRLDLHENTSRDHKAIERFDGARRRLEYIDHALVRAHLKLLARLLVDVRASQHGIPLDPRRNRNRAAHPGIGPLGMVDDFLR